MLFLSKTLDTGSAFIDVHPYVEEKFEPRITEEASRLRAEISQLRSEMIEKIESVRSELIKWMFLFWVGQIGAILGILFAFFRR